MTFPLVQTTDRLINQLQLNIKQAFDQLSLNSEPVTTGSISPTFLFNNSGASSGIKTISFKRVGNVVSLWTTAGTIVATSNGSDTHLTTARSIQLPTWAQPNFSGGLSFYGLLVEENGGQLASPGILYVSGGTVEIYKSGTLSAFAAGTGGTASAWFVSYTAD